MEKEELIEEVVKGLNRRNFLKSGALGLIGAGFTLGGIKMFEGDALGAVVVEDCDHITVMAKHGRTLKVPYFSGCLPCDCPGHFRIKQTIITTLITAPSCDETKTLIPDKSRLKVTLTRTFRNIGPHNMPVGCHKGTFVIQIPSAAGGFITVASGSMKGIDGMTANHPLYGENFCNQPWHDEGCLDGKGRLGTSLEGCTLHGTYVSLLPVTTAELFCIIDPWKQWQIHLTVCIHCPCPVPVGG